MVERCAENAGVGSPILPLGTKFCRLISAAKFDPCEMGTYKFKSSINSIAPVVLLGIILLGALLRVGFLSRIPDGFFCDEASAGYDAYSLLKTQCDRYGKFMPLFSRSFGDYPEATYRYLTIPFIAILGLNEFAARLPEAVISVFSILILYFLCKELFNERIALVAALLLAISPWHIQFSRNCMNCYNLFPFFFCLALLFFLKARKKVSYLFLSSVMFSFSIYTYYAAIIFTPLFLFGLGIIFLKNLLKNKVQVFIASGIFLSFFILLSLNWMSPEGMARAKGTLHLSLSENIRNYARYFSPRFLFFRGDSNLRHCISGMGQLYLFELITVLAGIVRALLGIKRKEHMTLFLWLFLYPIPAALTDPYHAGRSIIGAPLFSILSAFGLFTLINLFKPRIMKTIFLIGSILIVTFSFAVFCRKYFLDYPKYSAEAWQYGMREAITYAERNSYDQVVLSSNFREAYTFALFYAKYPPTLCQHNLRQGNDSSFGRYHICSISNPINITKRSLFIINPTEFKEILSKKYECHVRHVIRDAGGSDQLFLVEARNKN